MIAFLKENVIQPPSNYHFQSAKMHTTIALLEWCY